MYSLKAIFRVSHPTISNCFTSWQESDLVGLRNQPGQERKSILDSSDEYLVKAKVKASPQTLRKAREELKEELQRDFSQRTLERFLKNLSSQLEKSHKESKIQLKDIFELQTQEHIDVYYGDESGFSLNYVVPYCWQFPDEPVCILPQKGKNVNVFGLWNADGKQLFTFNIQGTIKADFVIEALETFMLSLTKPTVLVLDNTKIHHTKILQVKLDQWQQKGLCIF